MNEKNVLLLDYMDNPVRIADYVNVIYFDGNPVVQPEAVKMEDSTVYRIQKYGQRTSSREFSRDILRKIIMGTHHIIIGIEHQSGVDYTMPLRIMNYDIGGYEKQLRILQKQHKENGDLSATEYLSGISKKDRLKPFVTSLLYFSEDDWDGPMDLHDMLDFTGEMAAMKKWVANYPIQIIEARKEPDWRLFQSDLRWLFGYLQNLNDIQSFVEEYRQQYTDLPDDIKYAICRVTDSDNLWKMLTQIKEQEGESDMCKAIQALINDGEARGEARGETKNTIALIRKKLDQGLSPEAIAHWMELDLNYVATIQTLHTEHPTEDDISLTRRILA